MPKLITVPRFLMFILLNVGKYRKNNDRLYRRYLVGFGYRLFGIDWTTKS